MQIDAAAINGLVNAAISAAIGAGVTVIGFREKLSILKRDVEYLQTDGQREKQSAASALLDVRRDFQALCTQLSERADSTRVADRELFERLYREMQREMGQSERRQRYVMELITAIAQKNGIHHRLTDVLLATPSEGD